MPEDPMAAALAALIGAPVLFDGQQFTTPAPPTPEQQAAQDAGLDADLKEAANQLLDALADRDKIDDYIERLRDFIREKSGPGGKIEVVPGVGFTVSGVPTEFSEAIAKATLTPDQLVKCYANPKFSVTVARKALGDDLVDSLSVPKPDAKPTVKRI